MLMRVLIGTALVAALPGLAFADPADDALRHFKAITTGEVENLMNEYANDAVLNWVGGPLDGVYDGRAEVRKVWSKFTKAQGTLVVAAAKVEAAVNAKGTTVTANVEFKGKAPIKVRYVLLYRAGKLVNEIWQIDPHLAVVD